jgi:hypothetical protein
MKQIQKEFNKVVFFKLSDMKAIILSILISLTSYVYSQKLTSRIKKILYSSVEKIESFGKYNISVANRFFDNKCMYYIISISSKSTKKEIVYYITYTQDKDLILMNPDFSFQLDSLTQILIINKSNLKIGKYFSTDSIFSCNDSLINEYLLWENSFTIPNVYRFNAKWSHNKKTINIQYNYQFYGDIIKSDRPIDIYQSNHKGFYYDTTLNIFESTLYWDFKNKNIEEKKNIEYYIESIMHGNMIIDK